MIPANELRIGNLFYPIDESGEINLPISVPLKVISISESEVEAIFHDEIPCTITNYQLHKLRDIAPIPITSEILERFWFKKDGNTWYHKKNEFLTIVENNSWVNGVPLGKTKYILYKNQAGAIKEVEYLHHFQNLWLDITSEELEIKELQTANK